MILGDGCLCITRGSKNAILTITHSIKQKEYLSHKAHILEELTSVNVRESEAKGGYLGKSYKRIQVFTKTHPLYTSLYERMYHSKVKTVDTFCMKTLSPQGLALWYQDDGYLETTKHGTKCVIFCTHSYPKTELEMMCYYLKKKFDLSFATKKYKEWYLLRLHQKENDKFVEIVSPYIVDCMRYKLAITKQDAA